MKYSGKNLEIIPIYIAYMFLYKYKINGSFDILKIFEEFD